MRVAFLIAVKDLRQRLRDRSALLVTIVAPLGLAIVFSQLIGSAAEFHAKWVVADLDGGRLALALRTEVIGSMATAGVADITDVRTADEATAAVADGSQDAAFVIPGGFTAAIEAGKPAVLRVIGAQDSAIGTEVARSLAQRFGDNVVAVQLSLATVQALASASLPAAEQARIIGTAAQARPPVALVDEVAALRQLSLPSYFSASMAIMFLFFSAQVGMVSIFDERRQGTLARMLAGPIRPATVLFGKTLGAFILGVASMAVLVIATSLLIHADWGPPPGVAGVAVAGVIAAVGISTLVTSFANTPESAGAANSAVAITLAVLCGSFSPTAQAPDVMATLALFTPHGWFMRGLGDMHGAGSSAADALPAIGVLLLIGLATGALGLARARRLVVPE